MDNGWKSEKDKNGNVKHYKTNKNRKPYGVSRELAAEEVQAMRKNGQKARLIKTNRRLDLYAPYESVISAEPEEKLPNKKFSSYEEIEKEYGMSRSEAREWAKTHLYMLAKNPKDDSNQYTASATVPKVQELKKQLSEAVPHGKEWNDENTKIYSKDGLVYVSKINASNTVMLYEETEGTYPSDKHTFTIPNITYEPSSSGSVWVDSRSQEQLIKMITDAKKLNKKSEPLLYFTTPKGSGETYVGVFDTDHNLIGKPMTLSNQTITDKEVTDIIAGNYMAGALRSLKKMGNSLGERNINLMLAYKSDYPAKLFGGANGVSVNALIAPRMSESNDISIMNNKIFQSLGKIKN